MHCCATRPCGAGRFFSRFARRHRRRYLKKGLEKSQRHLIDGLRRAGIARASLLEIGCGVGYLHQALLKAGAARAVGIDMSEKMLAEARALAAEQGLDEHTDYRLGDFVALAPGLEAADVTLLDKVVCCYPDAEALVTRSLEKTRRVYALTYPRPHLLNRLGATAAAFVMWLARANFRPYVHDPGRIEAWIAERGFHKRYENCTLLWLTQVYLAGHTDETGQPRQAPA